jgi:carbon-monoxide dehydrogenase catalytic subunit
VPPVLGSSEVTSVLTKGVGGVIGATFAVEPDPFKAASLMIDHIDEKRRGLEL